MATTGPLGMWGRYRRAAAEARAPAGSAIMPSEWYRSSISEHTAPSGITITSPRHSRRIGNVTSPTRPTAVPSTKLSTWSSDTGLPARNAALMEAAPSGSTPITLMEGRIVLSHSAIPAARPPPPIGSRTQSVSAGICSASSTAMVPWPAITIGSL